MTMFVYADKLYDRMVELGVSANKGSAYQTILAKKKEGKFIYPKAKQNIRMKFRPEWIDEIIADLFDVDGKGSWSLDEHQAS